MPRVSKYAVSIHWTDSEDTGTDEFLTLEEAGEFGGNKTKAFRGAWARM